MRISKRGTLLLDLIGSHMLMLVDWYVGDVEDDMGIPSY